MDWTQPFWIEGTWPGKLAVSARPRGGDWLDDELLHWSQSGINTIVSLLSGEEERDLDLADESSRASKYDIKFLSFPIVDRDVPDSDSSLRALLEELDGELRAGRNVLLHCRQGVGRSGLVAACLLATQGIDAEVAVRQISTARGVTVPETRAQRIWIDEFAGSLAASR